MGLSTSQRHLQCVPCRKTNLGLYRMTGDISFHTWQQVKVIKAVGLNGALCKCSVCGHEYVSKSTAARNQLNAKSS